MNHSIDKPLKPETHLRVLNLSIQNEEAPSPNPECEVIEFEGEEGWQHWRDSVFVQDFEESVLTAPAPLFKAQGD
ncbi:hypothetical protein [Rhodoferax sp. GW822-FHT02A01]|uniref:hypothetical protein n=1 Tax=Rhodoferax sp. GW822-FHT02A01 TaxID=3141537 RepID=UPI00315DDD4B